MDAYPPELLLADHSPHVRTVAERLRSIVRAELPDAIERVRPRWRLIGYDVPKGRRTAYAIWIWPQPEHVHLGFEHGVVMDDPEGRLEGAGITRRVRWLTYRSLEEVDRAVIRPLLHEAVRVARLGRDERLARLLDRGG